MSAPFEISMSHMFERTNIKKYPEGPFTNTLRIFLVDSILNNLTFFGTNEDSKSKIFEDIVNIIRDKADDETSSTSYSSTDRDKKLSKKEKQQNIFESQYLKIRKLIDILNSYRGLPFMLGSGSFDSAFILHDESKHRYHLNSLIHFIEQQNETDESHGIIKEKLNQILLKNNDEKVKVVSSNLKESTIHFSKRHIDTRRALNRRWASFKNLFRFQPMWIIRNYFGEYCAFYFAWLGTFISCLWIPVIFGIIIFCISIVDR
jgi:hypothetical protein